MWEILANVIGKLLCPLLWRWSEEDSFWRTLSNFVVLLLMIVGVCFACYAYASKF
jgi:hypothetical protein